MGIAMITRRGAYGALGPFLPVLIGVVLKFSLVDQPGTDIAAHFKTIYLSKMWIDFIVTAYISGIAWFLTRQRIDGKSAIALLILPLVCFVVCVGLKMGLVKFGIENEFLTIYLPVLVAAISVAVAGNALAVAE
jgi:hypothetical protein